jgi:hypothetical protein
MCVCCHISVIDYTLIFSSVIINLKLCQFLKLSYLPLKWTVLSTNWRLITCTILCHNEMGKEKKTLSCLTFIENE